MSKQPILELKLGIQMFGGDEDLYRKTLESFDDNSNLGAYRILHHHILSMKHAEISISACIIFSLAGFICANCVSRTAHNIYLAANKKDTDRVLSEYVKLLQETILLSKEISKVVGRKLETSQFFKHLLDIKRKYNIQVEMYQNYFINFEGLEFNEACHNNVCTIGCNIF